MATEMELQVPAMAFPLGSVFENEPDVTVELERLIPNETVTIPYFWVRGGDAGAVESAFESHEGVTDIRLIDSVDDEHLMRAKWVQTYNGLLAALAEANLTLLSAVGTREGWRFEVRGDSQEAMAAFREYRRERELPVEITTVHALFPIQSEGYALTDSQREALILAYERGYFDTPRRTSLEDIAAELDITQQSLSSRLRRGHRRLLAATLAGP